MGKGNTFCDDILKLIFQAVGIANIADNAATSPLTSLYVALHTANPGAGGSQTTSEATYTSYARVGVSRNSGGWSEASQSVSPVSPITFPAATGGSETETYFSIGTLSSGAGKILYSGTISPTITVTSGVTPQLTTGSTITEA